jgi:hypothetical protein
MRHECTKLILKGINFIIKLILKGIKMIEVLITQDMIEEANRKASEMGELRNSIRHGEGNVIGFLGELVAQKVLGGMIDNDYDHDLLLDDFMTTVDVKTKSTTVTPKDYYDCSVAAYNTKQKCDYYCFVRVKEDMSVGWYLGKYKKNDYFKDALKLAKGQIDPANNYTVKADCYNMKISSLIQDIG